MIKNTFDNIIPITLVTCAISTPHQFRSCDFTKNIWMKNFSFKQM